MNTKRSKKILLILIGGLLIGNKTYASELEQDPKGVIIIEQDGTEKDKTKYLCDKIADFENGSCVMKPEYLNQKLDINHLHTTEELKQFIDQIDPKEKNNSMIAYSNPRGEVCFEQLEDGVYFLRSEEMSMIPVLVSIPMWNERERRMLYKVNVVPKYTNETSKYRKNTVETGDFNVEIIPMLVLLLLSFFAILLTKKILNILQKY